MNGKKVRGGYTVWTPGQDPGVFVSSFFNRYLSLSCLQLVLTGISRRQKHPSQKSKLQMSPLIFYHSLNRKATSGIDVAWIIVFSQLKSRKQRCYLIYKSIYVEEEKYLQKNNILWHVKIMQSSNFSVHKNGVGMQPRPLVPDRLIPLYYHGVE